MGPNSTLYGSVYVVKSTASGSVGNSLGTSDSCPTFLDSSGGTNATGYDSLYLPPITARLNGLLQGNLTLVDSDVSNFPYLCGFESQITGRVSPWCGVFEENELLQYEYRQDLRYYYGTGWWFFLHTLTISPLIFVPYRLSISPPLSLIC